ncbi:polysaccharide pyruvyl transferase family protein [Butyrivibrio sp. YAB3001]|uniref:polysaccharide pyruvyl transferase family protein n=1 Tax=Butyrivibrio sp. YAB3001 TaxID=1520812 RepID=UPI0008F67B7F|nr:polysaccharide pyruvyl transferase family protein [Butyrivibrio sp. YAB3001]SFC77214.1 Polysaccharide pyruvyl transferase family protein WcaK [Butyrivibrio sp. YAB3001]
MDLNRPIILYMHAGSGNHGCEAIANSTIKMIERKRKDAGVDTHIPVIVVTNSVAEDRKYSLSALEKKGLCRLVEDRHIDREFLPHVFYYGYRKISGDRESFLRFKYKDAFKVYEQELKSYKGKHPGFKAERPLAVSIGGDNYCYPEMVEDLILAHNVFRGKGFETVLWGCSIEPDSLKSKALVSDLKAYSRIYARESITYNALLDAGIAGEKLVLRNDPAFELVTDSVKLPDNFLPDNTVGINLSPMVQAKENVPGITLLNYRNFISYILDETGQNVALIPHVVWANNDDRIPLKSLYDEFKETGRVTLIDDASATTLKGYISKCSFFVGARTHSTIAAYSCSVPTIVIGYSVKSRGIATDLFGTTQNYVLPVQKLKTPNELIKAYEWMIKSTYKKM